MSCPEVIRELVHRYRRNERAYLSNQYNETRLRREFLDPMFECLGWDVANTAGLAEAYKDVVHEDSFRAEEGLEAPDYCFRVGGTRKFFLEAKRPGTDIAESSEPARQLRRYAWSARLPLSVLSNFRNLSLYDCRQKSKPTDSAATSRVLFLGFEEYEQQWERIRSILSKDAVLKGDFDEFIASHRLQRGTAQVNEAFLHDIEQWRKALARNIAKRNARISVEELNRSVQLIIDRIVFLRICEDRGIERYGQLRELSGRSDIYGKFSELCRNADSRYNSGLFHFRREQERNSHPDTVTLGLSVDDAVLKAVIRRLYLPESDYEFSAIPAPILGQVYEQFLGRVISLTSGHQARVEYRPEVNKKEGVYYTPEHIVRFIVQRSLDPLLRSKSLSQVAELKILDPACGSGSFLIEVYEHLLNWYLDKYRAQSRPSSAKVTKSRTGALRLTIAEKKRILLNHIFGVDKDEQAVEVTKLSLLLKVLEGESQDSVARQQQLFQERVLPDLDGNIRRGNSLVDRRILANRQDSLFGGDSDGALDVATFEWAREFEDIFSRRNPGFDAIVGNPPYVYRNATDDFLRDYYEREFRTAQGNFELYKFFVERCAGLLRTRGRLGMIVSATFMVQPSFSRFREFILQTFKLDVLAPLGPKAFENATVDTAIFIGSRTAARADSEIQVFAPSQPDRLVLTTPYSVRQTRFTNNDDFVFDYRLSESGARLVRRLHRDFESMETGFHFGVGINTGYIKDELVSDRREDRRYHRMVPGDGVSRFGPLRTEGWIMYDREYVRSRGDRGRSLPEEFLLSSDKILVVRTRNLSLRTRIIATIDRTAAYNLNRLSNIVARDGYSLEGLLGVLSSDLYNWLYSTRYFDYEIKPVYLRASPIPDVNDRTLVRLVTERLELGEVSAEDSRGLRRASNVEAAINERVYHLFDISQRDRRMIDEFSIGRRT